MDLDCVAFALTPPWRDKRLVLVRATDAARLCRAGDCEALAQWQSVLNINSLVRRDLSGLREFAARARLSRFPLSCLDDQQLLTLLGRALKTHEVVALTVADSAGESGGQDSIEQRRLVREIERVTHGRLNHQGRRYKLVTDVALAKLPNRDSYEVVRHDDAVAILWALAKDASTASELTALLGKATQMLTPDWRPPLVPDGLILLRKIVAQQSVGAGAAETITPSQMKNLLTKTEWIEVVVVDDLGKPYTGPYSIQLPDGSIREGNFDEQGLWGDYAIDPGACRLVLPAIPETVKPGTLPPPPRLGQRTWIALKVVDDDGNAIEGRPYQLNLTEGSEHRGQTGTEEIRVDDLAPGTCTFSLLVDGGVGASAGASPAVPDAPSCENAAERAVAVVDSSPITGAIEAVVQDDDGHPIANHPFEAHFSDGTVKKGQTSEAGLIQLEKCPGEQCTLKFVEGP